MPKRIFSKTDAQLLREAQDEQRRQNLETQKANAVQARAWLEEILESGIAISALRRILKTSNRTLSDLASGRTKRIPDRLFLSISEYHADWRLRKMDPMAGKKTEDVRAEKTLPVIPADFAPFNDLMILREIERVERRIAILKQLLELGKQL